MLELYSGDGKGKTTAAVGLAVRAAGHGIPVFFAQMMKDGTSGEIRILETLPGVRIFLPDREAVFTFRMTEEEKCLQRASFLRLLEEVSDAVGECPELQDLPEEDPEDQNGPDTEGECPNLQKEQDLPEENPEDQNVSDTERESPKPQRHQDDGKSHHVRAVCVIDELLTAVEKGLLPESAAVAFLERIPDGTEVIFTGRGLPEALKMRASYISQVNNVRHPYESGLAAREGIEY